MQQVRSTNVLFSSTKGFLKCNVQTEKQHIFSFSQCAHILRNASSFFGKARSLIILWARAYVVLSLEADRSLTVCRNFKWLWYWRKTKHTTHELSLFLSYGLIWVHIPEWLKLKRLKKSLRQKKLSSWSKSCTTGKFKQTFVALFSWLQGYIAPPFKCGTFVHGLCPPPFF